MSKKDKLDQDDYNNIRFIKYLRYYARIININANCYSLITSMLLSNKTNRPESYVSLDHIRIDFNISYINVVKFKEYMLESEFMITRRNGNLIIKDFQPLWERILNIHKDYLRLLKINNNNKDKANNELRKEYKAIIKKYKNIFDRINKKHSRKYHGKKKPNHKKVEFRIIPNDDELDEVINLI